MRTDKQASFKNAMLKAPQDTFQPNPTESSQIEKAYFDSLLEASSNKNPKRIPENIKPKVLTHPAIKKADSFKY
jgi:hypothetical protein